MKPTQCLAVAASVAAVLVPFNLVVRCSADDDARAAPALTVGAGGVLLRNGKPYRAFGVNYFNAFLRVLADHDDTTYRRGFAELAKRDIPFVRFAACPFWPVDWKPYLDDKEAYFRLLDGVVKAAEDNDIGLVASVMTWWPSGIPDLVGEPVSQWGNPESETVRFMRRYTREMVTRYLDSPAIWVWEFGNEYSLSADIASPKHRPPVAAHLGTPKTRSAADDLTHDMVVVACREFAEVVRGIDGNRPITTGHSLPRPVAQHLRTERKWVQDTPGQFVRNLLDVTPDPFDMISVHIYAQNHRDRFGRKLVPYRETLSLCMDAAKRSGKSLFVGEFGASHAGEHGGPEEARKQNREIIAAIDRCRVPLAALWVYDYSRDAAFNVTPTNERSYLLDLLQQANLRGRGSGLDQ